MSLVRTELLRKQYARVVALDDLTLTIDPRITGLVGANGAGKSTPIKILLGLLDATSGTAEVLGLNASRDGLRIRELMGYIPEHDCLPPEMSATNFVVHMARMSGLPSAEARERTAEVMRHVGLFEERLTAGFMSCASAAAPSLTPRERADQATDNPSRAGHR